MKSGLRSTFRRLSLFLLLWLLVGLSGRLLAFRVGLSLTLEAPGQVSQGEQFEVLLSVDADVAADGGSLLLSYNSACFRYDGTQAGPDTSVSVTGGEGQLTLVFGPIPSGGKRLAVLLMTAQAVGSGRFTIENSRFTAAGEELGSPAAVYAFVVAAETPEPLPELPTAAPTRPDNGVPTVETVKELPQDLDDPLLPGDSTRTRDSGRSSDGIQTTGTSAAGADGQLTDSPLALPDGRTLRSTAPAQHETIEAEDPLPGDVQTAPSQSLTENPYEDEELLALAQRLERIVPLILIPLIVLVVALIIWRIVRRRP
ncbi:MAG: hypothetical protein QM270_11280 [Bacillota bacterium]|nr:hypothetical protein [Bacillota bacterium]